MLSKLCLLPVVLLLSVSLVTAQNSRPNILVIFSDDHAQQTISAYGSRLMQTPGIDRIAKEGAIMQNSFVTNSICAPSRAVLLTGKYSHLNGLKDNSARRRFDGSQQQLQKILGAAQYQTAWIGKWHLQTLPQGFDFWRILPDQGHYYQPDFINMKNDTVRYNGYVTNLISDFSIDWLQQRDKDKPFFLVVGEKATHREWLPDLQDLGAFDNTTFPEPANFRDKYSDREAAAKQDMTIAKTMTIANDLKVNANYNNPRSVYGRLTDAQKTVFKKYYDGIAQQYESIKNDSAKLVAWKLQRYLKDYLSTAKSLDRNISRILDYLDASGLAKNTLVVYVSDQGFYMGEHGWFDKRFMYEESLRTPLVMRYPGHIKPGTTVKQMVVNIDMAPTFLEAAGIQKPFDMQGESFLPIVSGNKTKPWRDEMYYHYYEYPEPHRVAPHFGIRTSRYKLIRFYGPKDYWELYDLQKDKTEIHNLYNQPAHKATVAKLKQQLNVLIAKYKDEEAADILKQR